MDRKPRSLMLIFPKMQGSVSCTWMWTVVTSPTTPSHPRYDISVYNDATEKALKIELQKYLSMK
jgi:hypothetical protein